MENDGRRKFLGLCLGALASCGAAATVGAVYRYLAPRTASQGSNKVAIPARDVPEGEAKFFEYAGSSAVLVRKRGGDLVALSAVCTNLGCIVQWEKEKQDFLCPCHGGHYSAEGAVTAGPPPRPLARLPLSVANGVITVG